MRASARSPRSGHPASSQLIAIQNLPEVEYLQLYGPVGLHFDFAPARRRADGPPRKMTDSSGDPAQNPVPSGPEESLRNSRYLTDARFEVS